MRISVGLFFSFCFVANFIYSQLPVGSWQAHLPYASSKAIVNAGNKFFVASETGMFSYDVSDNSLDTYSKINGLSDVGLNALAFDPAQNLLIIGYSNGNLDLLQDNVFYNLPDIKNKDLQGRKDIYNICIHNNKAYLACDFGVVVMDVAKREIADAYLLSQYVSNLKVYDVFYHNEIVYAASSQGLYAGDANLNLQDFSTWQKLEQPATPSNDIRFVGQLNDKLVIDCHFSNDADSVYYLSNNSWKKIGGGNISKIRLSGDQLFIVYPYNLMIYNSNFGLLKNIPISGIKDACQGLTGQIVMAHEEKGIVNQDLNFITPVGPTDYSVYDVAAPGNGVACFVPGGLTAAGGNVWYKAKLFYLKNNKWHNFTMDNTPGLSVPLDFLNLLVDPNNPAHVLTGSWGYGVWDFTIQNNEVANLVQYHEENSALQNVLPNHPHEYIWIGGMAFDPMGNLWISNAAVDKPIVVKKKNGQWASFSGNDLLKGRGSKKLIVSSYGYKWLILTDERGLFVMDDRGSIDNTSDDRYNLFSVKDQENETSNKILSIAEDRDGTIWVGTALGVLTYYNQESVFSGTPTAYRIIQEINGDAQYLLKSEAISAVAIDGANRKWFGTQKSGVFLISSDGSSQIMNFTTSNSPLASNNITSLAIDPQTGEVYIGTDKGLFSYKGTANDGNTNFSGILVFPNPVRENYTGLITIKGLMENSNVKITDINGNLVYETTSNGGMAIWNGKNFENKRVATGVYLVFCTTSMGEKSAVEKLLFIH